MRAAAPTDEMKSIDFEDGLLRFRVPASWVQSEDPSGGGLFYGEGEDRGMLRVRAMTFTSQQRLSNRVALSELEALVPEPGQKLEQLPNGNALRAHREIAEADGERTALHIWMLASIDQPHRLRLAVFSYVVMEHQESDSITRQILAALDREIRDARFGHQIS